MAVREDELVADRVAAKLGEGGEPLDGALGRGDVGVPGVGQEAAAGLRAGANGEAAVEGGVGDCIALVNRGIVEHMRRRTDTVGEEGAVQLALEALLGLLVDLVVDTLATSG